MDPLVPLSYINILANTTNNGILILVIILLLISSAFFSAVETALTSCNKVRLSVKADDGKKSAKLVLAVLKRYDKSLISILIGNNVVNTVSSVLAYGIAFHLVKNNSLATIISTVVMTILVFTFGEIIPKNIAKANADKMSQILCYPLIVIYIITYPIMQIFNFLLWLFKKIFKSKKDENILTEDEFQDIVEIGEKDGVIDEEESNIIQAAVDFNDTTVKSILTPKDKMVVLDYDKLSRNEILKNLNDIKFSRIPIYLGNKDHIIGILNIRKFLKQAINFKKFAIKQAMSEVIFVVDTTPLDEMIELFKNKKSHMAIVNNKDNELVGLVTMEDVLEELVGESKQEIASKGGSK